MLLCPFLAICSALAVILIDGMLASDFGRT